MQIKSTQENLKGLEVVLKEKDHEIANHENAVRAQLCTSIQPFSSQDLTADSPLQLLHISLKIIYKNLVFDQDNFQLISLRLANEK